jgi:hypothetical protein
MREARAKAEQAKKIVGDFDREMLLLGRRELGGGGADDKPRNK